MAVSTNPYSQPWKDSDIVLVLKKEKDGSECEEEFHCHSTILTLNSPVFESMFRDERFKEGVDKRATLTGKEREAFILFLDMMYPPTQTTQVSLGKRKHRDNPLTSELLAKRPGRTVPGSPPSTSTASETLATSSTSVPDGETSQDAAASKRDALKLFSTVLEYANEYLVECVRLRVDNLLSLEVHSRIAGYEEPKRDMKTCFEVLFVADTYKLNRLKAACLSYIWMTDDNFLYEDTCVKQLSPETQCILMKLEINKLGISDKREKRIGRERNSPLTIEISDVVQRNLISLSEYNESDICYNNEDYLCKLSVFETADA